MDRTWRTSCGSGVGVKVKWVSVLPGEDTIYKSTRAHQPSRDKTHDGERFKQTDEIKREKGEDNDWITITFFISVCMRVCVYLCVCLCEFKFFFKRQLRF